MTNEVINLQTYYVKKIDIIDNLTTDDALKPLSAKQGKKLQDTKLNKSQGLENANKNVITDSNGNITVGELNANIPTKTSDLTNDSDFITSANLPTKVSDLTNDSGFITNSSLPTKTSNLINDGEGVANKPFLTEHQDISGKVNTSDLATVAISGDYEDLDNKPSIPNASNITPSPDTNDGSIGTDTSWARSNHTHPKSTLYAEATHSHSYNDLTDKPDIPEGVDLTDYINNTKLVEVIDYATDNFIEDTTIQIICDSNIPYAENSTFEVQGTLFGPGRLAGLPIKLYIDDTLESTQNTNYNGDVIFNIDIPTAGTDMEIKLVFEGNDVYNAVTNTQDISIINSLTIQGALGRNYYPNASGELILTISSSYSDEELGNMSLYLNNALFSSDVHKGDIRINEEMLYQIEHDGNDILARVVSTAKNITASVVLIANS